MIDSFCKILAMTPRRKRRAIMDRYCEALKEQSLEKGFMDYILGKTPFLRPDSAAYALRTNQITQEYFDRNTQRLQKAFEELHGQ